MTTERPPKARIRQSFERAAPTYDGAADIQRAICAHLADSLPIGQTPQRILDTGCGTGHALHLLQARFPTAQQIALDFSPAMLHQVKARCCRLAGDLEHLPLANAAIDLYWSSLAVQWCDLQRVLGEARRVLNKNGHLAIATLGPETFRELRHAFADIDPYQHTLTFLSMAEVESMARQAGFATVNLKNHAKTAFYPDFKTLLRAVKAVGANQLGEGKRTGLISRRQFAQAEAACEILRTSAGLPLTYDVFILHAQP